MPGVVVNPCEYEPPALGAPPSFPGNFGAEAMYWNASTFGTFISSGGQQGNALLVMALEASGANAAALNDGNQAVFSRIRLRVNVPVAGTYRITHPYGSRDYVVTATDLLGERQINQTQDLGIAAPQDFLVAMNDGPPPVAPLFSSINVGAVNDDGRTVGPFLVPANPWVGPIDPNDPATFAGGPITVGDATYLALPFAPNLTTPVEPIEVFQPVTGSLYIPVDETEPANYFRIELISGGPDGFQLNPSNLVNPQRVQFDEFLLVGKLFNEAANTLPVAVNDRAGVASGGTVTIDAVANDTDVLAANNTHTINPQALVVANATGPVLNANGMPRLTATLPTTAGGSVRRVVNIASGLTSFLYTPPGGGFAGTDSFQYVVQDTGGLISAPATVDLTVEDLRIERADYRVRTGKWHLRGSSSDSLGNAVTLYAGPRARLTPVAGSAALGNASLRLSAGTIEFELDVEPLPVTTITGAHIHYGAPGTNGPIIFSLYESAFGVPFAVPRSGSLGSADLQVKPEVGITNFSAALEAIRSGNAYVNVRTTAFPAGELRGQLLRPVIGNAPVVGGQWEFHGHSSASPGALQSVGAESSNDVRLLGTPLRLR
ncbi:MAG: CHRD domain-containing protein [Trichloromonadaceae bacterium]